MVNTYTFCTNSDKRCCAHHSDHRLVLTLCHIDAKQAKLAAAERAGAESADAQAAGLHKRIAKLEAQKAGLSDSLQAGQAEIAALQVFFRS